MTAASADAQKAPAGRSGGAPGPGRISHRFRIVLVSAAGAVVFAVTLLLAYQLALARVPQHRATLERLVRAHTGLDVRFSELGLRWGWYGPEAVFRRVELGEPGRSNVLLRAPELIVGFDTWRSLRMGQLQAGRITLVAPDIDLERPAAREQGESQAAVAAAAGRARFLQRWQDGRIDIESGTLRLADPAGAISLQIRRASLRRSGERWNASALVFLPDRLGRTARIVASLTGDLETPGSLDGTVQFDGFRLLFAGWRELLASSGSFARYIPQSGGGDVSWRVQLQDGRIVGATGEVDAQSVVLAAPVRQRPKPHADSEVAGSLLRFARLGGKWRLARTEPGWRLQVESLYMAQADEDAPRALLTVDIAPDGRSLSGTLEEASAGAVAATARWLAPHLDLGGLDVTGRAHDIQFDWSVDRAQGQRLQASMQVDQLRLQAPSGRFALAGLGGQVTTIGEDIEVRLESSSARLDLAHAPSHPVTPLQVASTLRISREEEGWRVAGEGVELSRGPTRLVLNGAVFSNPAASSDLSLAITGTLTDADVAFLQSLLGEATVRTFGVAASQLSAGRIEHARFTLEGTLEDIPFGRDGRAFSGSATLKEAMLAGGENWPQAEGLNIQLEWSGARIRAQLGEGVAGPFRIASALAQWNAPEAPVRITGQATTQLEEALAWLMQQPRLSEHVPSLAGVAASGEALLDFDVEAGQPEEPAQVRVAASLEGARLRLAPGLPEMEAVRGAVAFDGGRLQRSTLAAQWLGGPMTLRIVPQGGPALELQAQGLLDAGQLAALAALDEALGEVTGRTEWRARLLWQPVADSSPSQWRLQAESTLLGVNSRLPAPLAKSASQPMPLRIESSGSGHEARLQVTLAQRFDSAFVLWHDDGAGWRLERGAMRLGDAGVEDLPQEPGIFVDGRVSRLDLPGYLRLWRQVRREVLVPPLQAELSVETLLLAGRSYSDVGLQLRRVETGTELHVQSGALQGMVRWPEETASTEPVEVRLARLDLPEPAAPAEVAPVLDVLSPAARVSVDSLSWQGRPLGRLTARLLSGQDGVILDDLRLAGGAHEGRGSVLCPAEPAACRMSFELVSRDAAATLRDFGFRDDVSASQATLAGDLEWSPQTSDPWLAALTGQLRLRLSDGTTRTGINEDAPRFGLLAVPALVSGMARPEAAAVVRPGPVPAELRFTRLEADYELREGSAFTSNLHFDGEAEILMRGRTGILARDYDHEVWILRGEDRLPAAVRRLGPTPSVAAAWMSLRELLGRKGGDRSRPVVSLVGTWSEPVITPEEE